MSSTKPANSTGTEKKPEVTDEAVQPPVPTPAVENAAPSDPTVEKPADVVAPPSETKSEVKPDSKAEKHKEDIKVEQVAEEPEPGPPPYTAEQVYIAVMGQTGVGKSSFINDATNWALPIGHTLHACTQDIQLAETIIQDRRVVFIDTPGFDDTYRDDTTILELIGRYLKDAAQEIKLTGVLYLQRITDNRVGGCALMHMRLLKRLCGTEYYGNVVLATTHWDTLRDKKIGAQREDQLRNSDDFWGDFIKEGATIQRHEPGRESAIAVVQHLLNKSPAVLQFQRELAKHGIVGETAAGQELILSLGRLKAKHAEEVQTLREEIKAATAVANNLKDNKKAMEKKVSVMEERIEDLTKDIANLQKTLSERKEEENWKPKVLEREQCIVQ